MSYILIQQASDFVEKNVTVKGWVTHIRHSGKLVFF